VSGGSQHTCAQSPNGYHKPVEGTTSEHCAYCGLIYQYLSVGPGQRLVKATGREVAQGGLSDGAAAVIDAAVRDLLDPLVPVDIGEIKAERRYKKIVALIERDGAECFFCEHALLDPRDGVLPEDPWWPTTDHFMPRVRGGTNALSNLVLACARCNRRKGEHLDLVREVIKRLRKERDDALEGRKRDQGFITRMQWELFDAGLGEIPGHTELHRRKKTIERPSMAIRDPDLFAELGDRVIANLRSENVGAPHSRTAAVVKRCRAAAGVALSALDTKGRRRQDVTQ
jgi:hypothetical protein